MALAVDYYGLTDTDLERLADRVAKAAGLTFKYRESNYIGDYYMAQVPPGKEVKVMRNLDALDGGLRWGHWAEFKLIIEAALRTEGEEGGPPAFLDELRESLAEIPGLTHLQRTLPRPPVTRNPAGA